MPPALITRKLLISSAVVLYTMAGGILLCLVYYLRGADLWSELAARMPLAFVLGIVFGFIFYHRLDAIPKTNVKNTFFLMLDVISALLLAAPIAIYIWGIGIGWMIVFPLLLVVLLIIFFQWIRNFGL